MGKMLNHKTAGLAMQIPQQIAARSMKTQPPLPFSYTFSVTTRCNSRCKTCRIYEQLVNDMALDEWRLIFQGLGKSPYWATMSGGEPFMRRDFEDIVIALDELCSPAIINIPTNGICPDIAARVEYMRGKVKAQLVVNVSIDHNLPEQNNLIRGVPVAYERAVKTFEELKKVKGVTVGIHTVISRFNVADFKGVCDSLMHMGAHQYITEIAEERRELGSIGLGITPGFIEYGEAVDYLLSKMGGAKGLSGFTEAFRREYYANVKRWLQGKPGGTCYAGRGVAHISADGEVWGCCIKAESMGYLRERNYSFKKVWQSVYAKKIRMEAEKCTCPMANVAYTNLLLNPLSLSRVAKRIIF